MPLKPVCYRALCLLLLCFVVVNLSHSDEPAKPSPRDKSSGENPSEYTWRNITLGAGGFAPNIIFSPVENGLAYLRTDMGGAYRWEAKIDSWVPLQDGMRESSYFGIESIAADPKNANVVHMAAGMYKNDPAAMLRSFDKGRNWEIVPVPYKMGGNEDGRGMGERLAIDPNNTDILYFGSRHDGLIRSTDKGASWHKLANFPYKGLGLPAKQYSTNAGISFIVFQQSSKQVSQAFFNQTSEQTSEQASEQASEKIYATSTLFVAVADKTTQHLFRSDDGAKSWQAVENEPPKHLRPAQGVIDGQFLYITYANSPGPNGVKSGAVYKHNINTGEWINITPGHNNTPNKKGSNPPGGFMGISVDAQNPGTLVVATMNRWHPGNTIFRSTDGGQSWVELAKRSSRDVSTAPYLRWGNQAASFGWWIAGLAINPFNSEELVYTTGATVYRTQEASSSGKIHWQPWISGIEQTAVITLRSLPEGPELLSGFGDISGFSHTNFDQSPQVMFTNPVFGNTNVIDYAAVKPNIVVRSGTPSKSGAPTLAYSEDFGMSWQALQTPKFKLERGEKAQRYDLSGDNALIVNADGSTLMFMATAPLISRDKGANWRPAIGLPLHARPIADKLKPQRFYALDFDNSVIYQSNNGGASFRRLATQGLPSNIKHERPTWREEAWPLLAAPYSEGHVWYVSGTGLYRSIDGGLSFAKRPSDLHVEEMDFGKPAPGRSEPSLVAIGTMADERAIWRSDDSGQSWIKISDDKHVYGQRYRCIAGDLRHFGRVYVGTDGRGIVMGEPMQ
ncbi:hypothetical protein SAMN02745866_02093 [Alteromonadaceae bacterium Bs31]|nr:hypothetical protein SAMN02745866_02093 [Alteromonadaceae bacterium Bs31]